MIMPRPGSREVNKQMVTLASGGSVKFGGYTEGKQRRTE